MFLCLIELWSSLLLMVQWFYSQYNHTQSFKKQKHASMEGKENQKDSVRQIMMMIKSKQDTQLLSYKSPEGGGGGGSVKVLLFLPSALSSP